MTVLDEIIAFKKQEITKIKKEVPLEKLVKNNPYFKRQPLSLKGALTALENNGIIAEFKRRSPSKGVINDKADIATVSAGYISTGASAQSILTDTHFFGGSVADILIARNIQQTHPILRKDFIVDGFQIVEAKAIGADVILLIANCLTTQEMKNFGNLAEDLGLEVLYEVHTREELDKIPEIDGKIIGINNRNLKNFEVDIENSLALSDEIPDTCIKVAESGINKPVTVQMFKNMGFEGFLIGECFMKTNDPIKACLEFSHSILQYENKNLR